MILPSRDDLLLHRIRKNISTRKKENKQSAIYIYIKDICIRENVSTRNIWKYQIREI